VQLLRQPLLSGRRQTVKVRIVAQEAFLLLRGKIAMPIEPVAQVSGGRGTGIGVCGPAHRNARPCIPVGLRAGKSWTDVGCRIALPGALDAGGLNSALKLALARIRPCSLILAVMILAPLVGPGSLELALLPRLLLCLLTGLPAGLLTRRRSALSGRRRIALNLPLAAGIEGRQTQEQKSHGQGRRPHSFRARIPVHKSFSRLLKSDSPHSRFSIS
jgi:hypothetical protein